MQMSIEAPESVPRVHVLVILVLCALEGQLQQCRLLTTPIITSKQLNGNTNLLIGSVNCYQYEFIFPIHFSLCLPNMLQVDVHVFLC